MSPKSCCARKALLTSATCRRIPGVGASLSRSLVGRSTSPQITRHPSSFQLMPASRSRSSAVSTSAVSSCLRTAGIRSVTGLKGKNVGVPIFGFEPPPVPEHNSRLCRTRSGEGHSLGGDPLDQSRWRFTPTARLTHSLGFRLIPRSSELATLAGSFSTVPLTVPGLSTSVACWRRIGTMSADHPVATKRVLRAIIKAADLCVNEPTRVAQQIVDGGFTAQL